MDLLMKKVRKKITHFIPSVFPSEKYRMYFRQWLCKNILRKSILQNYK